jgi:hypothetical protein
MFLSNVNQIWIFLMDVHKSPHYQISQKSIQWELHWRMRMDRQKDTTKLIGAFHDYVDITKNVLL